MSLILPYNKEFLRGEGGFIKPSGEIVRTGGQHERWSRDYCNGDEYDFLHSICYAWEGNEYIKERWVYYQQSRQYTGKREDIDIYESSKLSKEDLQLYKLWVEHNEERGIGYRYMYSDFIVFILGWDKLETVMRSCFTTTCNEPYTRFYNYFLMDWYIDHQTKKKYDNQKKTFIWDEKEDWYIKDQANKKAEEEINQIKKEVPFHERHLFFK